VRKDTIPYGGISCEYFAWMLRDLPMLIPAGVISGLSFQEALGMVGLMVHDDDKAAIINGYETTINKNNVRISFHALTANCMGHGTVYS
jgi:hypothetical protein